VIAASATGKISIIVGVIVAIIAVVLIAFIIGLVVYQKKYKDRKPAARESMSCLQ